MKSVAFRFLTCFSVTVIAWFSMGPTGLVWCAPLYGIAFAAPLLDGSTSSLRWLRSLAYRDVEGCHFAFKGISINVAEDSKGYMWLRLADIRKVMPALVSDGVLRQLLGSHVRLLPPDRAVRIQAEALLAHFEQATQLDTLKFMQWIERTVAFPSKQRRARHRNRCAVDRSQS